MDTQNPKITISELGKEPIIRDLTPEEIELLELASKEMADRRAAEAKAEAEKQATKAAVLAKLGLTEEQARALIA